MFYFYLFISPAVRSLHLPLNLLNREAGLALCLTVLRLYATYSALAHGLIATNVTVGKATALHKKDLHTQK